MFEQLIQLIQHYGNDAVVNNKAIPNEHNEAVMNEAGNSILSGLKDIVSSGNLESLAGILSGKSPVTMNNPVVKELFEKVSGNLGSKFGISSEVAGGVAEGLIPQILSGLVKKAQDPNEPGFNISDLIRLIGGNNSGLMDAVSKCGEALGLDQNGDGQVGINEAISAVSKNSGGLGSLLGKLFGK